jgi:hypothetical protein
MPRAARTLLTAAAIFAAAFIVGFAHSCLGGSS